MVLHLKDSCIIPSESMNENLPKYYVENLDFDYIYFKDDKKLLDELYTAYGECYIINIGTKAVEGVFLVSDDEIEDISLNSLDNFLETRYNKFLNKIRLKGN